MYGIGVLFDIDGLGGGLYGYSAYRIFFAAVDTLELAGCSLSDGDTNETLAGRAKQYCIAVGSLDASKIAGVKDALSASNAEGLLPAASRFLDAAAVSREPLVSSARVDAAGELVGCQTGWVSQAWQEGRAARRGSDPAPAAPSTTRASEGGDSSLPHAADAAEHQDSQQAAADWCEDPTGRHQYRYWDGASWTDHVSDDGRQSVDPLVVPPRGKKNKFDPDKWSKIRSKGKARYVLLYGVLLWGGLTGILMSFVITPIALVLFPLGGIVFGMWTWSIGEKRYREAMAGTAGTTTDVRA